MLTASDAAPAPGWPTMDWIIATQHLIAVWDDHRRVDAALARTDLVGTGAPGADGAAQGVPA